MTEVKLEGDFPPRDVLDSVSLYASLGWKPIPLISGTKRPRERDWNNKDYGVGAFCGDDNVGIRLGTPSGNLVDLDFDMPEARQLAEVLFSELPAFGRHGAPGGHRIVRCLDHPGKIETFRLTNAPAAEQLLGLKAGTDSKCVMLELRANGQTMFPPSRHPSGEVVSWESRSLPAELPNMSWQELREKGGLLALLALVLRGYPRASGNRDGICMALSGVLISRGLDDETVNHLIFAVASRAGDEEADKRGKAAATRAKMETDKPTTGLRTLLELLGLQALEKDVRKWLGKDVAAEQRTDGAIVMCGGELVSVVDRAEKALLTAGVPIYQRGGELVRTTTVDVARIDSTSDIRRPVGSTVLRPVSDHWLVEQMARTARWAGVTREGPKLADPKLVYARHLLARSGSWRFPVLRGFVSAPTLDRDGRIIEAPGYDQLSGLLLDFPAGMFPSIPQNPTYEMAKEALDRLDNPLRGFPFVSDASRSVALSAFLTAMIRPSMRTAPLHAFDAPAAGTGKSMLAEMAGILATGRRPPAMSQGKSPEEDEKRLSTVLRAGDPVILIDNCERPVEGDFLCSTLTQELVQARILGLSERVLLPSTALFLATGNNLQLSGDMARRAVVCRLDARIERPDQRKFDFDCQAEAIAHRAELVAYGLTALRAYVVAGRPQLVSPMGSFTDYEWVRGTLVWLGRADPADTRDDVVADDPRKAELAEIIAAWEEALGDRSILLHDLDVESATAPSTTALYRLRHVLIEATGRGQLWNAKSIGRLLRRHKDRVVQGRRFVSEDANGRQKWRLEGVRREM